MIKILKWVFEKGVLLERMRIEREINNIVNRITYERDMWGVAKRDEDKYRKDKIEEINAKERTLYILGEILAGRQITEDSFEGIFSPRKRGR